MKLCSKCLEQKPESDFPADKGKKSGLSPWCRPCKKQNDREYRAKKPEKRKASNAAYRERHRDAINTRERAKRPARQVQQRAWRDKNRERRNVTEAAWRKANPARIKRYTLKCRAGKEHQIASYRAEWARQNRILLRARAAKRRAVKRASACEHVDYRVVIERDKGVCHICGLSVETSDIQIDHVVPITRGGEHAMHNLAVSHGFCNRVKSDKLITELFSRL